MTRRLPRIIKPEHIDVGDLISVAFPLRQGIVESVRGRVDEIELLGTSGKRLWTREGGAIVTYYDREQVKYHMFVLIERSPVPAEPLPGI